MRFATAHDVLLAYPQLALGYQSPLDGTPVLEYVERLTSEKRWSDAVAFIAHLLPRREAVWWAIQSVRAAPRSFAQGEENLIVAAENWVKDPSESKRRHALALADGVDMVRPAGWVARAAGWSGGVLAEAGEVRVASQPHMSHAAARSAVLLACSATEDPQAYLSQCVAAGLTLAKKSDTP